ncbi:CHAD domain-containing protein [Streptomyces sp. NBC_01525]|uniref:CHAD domain-containing protein n=1 Tax=Streptomyces sp. NBC_01525 TaxID=2903893 RepID=UPI00386AE26A
MAQRPDLPAGGPGGLIGIGSGPEPGPGCGTRAAVVDGPGPYGCSSEGAAGTGETPPDGVTAGQALAGYLHDRSADFLRSLRQHRESGSDADGTEEAARQLRRAARRISATLHTFRPLTEEAWADQLRAELGWLSGALAREHALADRRDRLMAALQRLTGRTDRPQSAGRATGRGGDRTAAVRGAGPMRGRTAGGPAAEPSAGEPDTDGLLSEGAARAAALLDRQLTLARSRAHSAALQALGSARFHALADAVAVLASEVPLARAAGTASAAGALHPLAENAHRRLAEAVAALPPARAGHAHQADALSAEHRQDAPWHQVRTLVRLSRYAQEVVAPGRADPRLTEAGRALGRLRDATEAASAAASAARTPRIAPATAYALGVLHADQRHEVAAARHTFSRLWLPGPAPESRWS